MKKVSHHSSTAIIQREGSMDFMFHIYDSTYPRAVWRNKANLIGGNFNPDRKTASPYALLQQELYEEFSTSNAEGGKPIERSLTEIVGHGPGAPKTESFAPAEHIKELLENVGRVQPLQDYLVMVPDIDGKKGFVGVVSVYRSVVDRALFDEAKTHLAHGRNIRNEGLTCIASADDLVDGRVGTAWHTGRVMSVYLGREIPNPHSIGVEPIGLPLASFVEYAKRFEYEKPVV